ncbi:MAG: signal peptidase I [Bacteroidia bacterium]
MEYGALVNGVSAARKKLEKLKKYILIARGYTWLVSFTIALLLFFIVKIFLYDIVKVSGNDMQSTYKRGDSFLVKKFGNNYTTNDILYFRYPAIDSIIPKTYCIQRLVGLPGDTIEIKDKKIYLNNYMINDTTSTKYNYFIKTTSALDTSFKLKHNLFEGGPISDKMDYSYSLTKWQADELAKDSLITSVELKKEPPATFDETVFPYSTHYNWNMDNFGKLYLPKKGDTLSIDSANIIFYTKLIVIYENNALFLKGDSIFINDKHTKKYAVKNNYYFVLGDNRDNANDSRVFGFLPENYIKGKVISILKKK